MTDNVAGDPQQTIADLKRRLDESIAQQTATADVFKVISRSTFDLQTVLETLIKSAVELCGANRGSIFLRDGDVFPLKAASSTTPEFLKYWAANPPRAGRGSATSRVIASGKIEVIPDVLEDPDMEMPAGSLVRIRAALGVPMLRNDKVEGVLVLTRPDPGPFTKSQIDLVQTFADQATIAIENARLFDETKEALERQTATSEVLGIINSSPGDLKTVFEAMVEKARRLCDADSGHLALPVGDDFRTAAVSAMSPDLETMIRAVSYAPGRGTAVGRSLLERRAVQIADIAADSEHAARHAGNANLIRTILGVPLLREGEPIGAFGLSRSRVEPFTERQIELVETFAAQAVIAIENTRLFNETRESLRQQTATADVLKVISRSAFNLQAVLDTLVESAVRLCEADGGTIFQPRDGDYRLSAGYGLPPETREFLLGHSFVPGKETVIGRVLLDGSTVHIPDLQADPNYRLSGDPNPTGGRLGVPLLREGVPIGVFVLARRSARPFTEKQIELVQTFADQAVIAIENTRLFNEVQAKTADLQESLQHQTATSEVLKVISRSPGELNPVFETILASATSICEAQFGLLVLYEGGGFRCTSTFNLPPAFAETFLRNPVIYPPPIDPLGRLIETQQLVHVVDVKQEPAYLTGFTPIVELVELGGARTLLLVPMLKEDGLVGVIAIFRQTVHAFSEKQIELVTSFGNQAVIAIENAHLLGKLRERTDDLSESLQQQTATADVLKVISRSAFDLDSVLTTLTESAKLLCGAAVGVIFRREGDVYRYAASTMDLPHAYREHEQKAIIQADRGTLIGRVALERGVVHVPDAWSDPDYKEKNEARMGNVRAMLGVPLMLNGEPIGAFGLSRRDPVPFTERQVELVTTFADQAVIAIENARLFDEVQAKTRDLSESLQQQTATADVLKVISRSAFDLKSVLTTLIESAKSLCGASLGIICLRDGEVMRLQAESGCTQAFVDFMDAHPIKPGRETITGRVFMDGKPVHVADVELDPEYNFANAPAIGAYRAVLAVPLMRDAMVEGVLLLGRPRPGPFSQRQLDLVQTFADQAVIAIENARLFNETKQALERQTATAGILKVIASSPSDAQPVFEAIVKSANTLIGGFSSTVFRFIDGVGHLKAFTPTNPAADEVLRASFPLPVTDFLPFKMAQAGEATQIADTETLSNEILGISRARGFRSILFAPMMNDGVSIGSIAVTRILPGKFADHHVQLLQTFADQAVIAIENVRLFDEVQARTRELTLSLDELRTAQDRLVQTEKLASLGQLTAGIAHEIKNPLNFVNNFSALSGELIDELNELLGSAALDRKTREEIDELTNMLKGNLAKVVQHGKRADSIVKNMLLHSREGSGERRAADINTIVEESLNLAYHGARAEKSGFNITLQRDFDPSAGVVDLYPQEITRVFLNLISNGFYAANKRRESGDEGFEPLLTATTKNLGSKVEIRIRDNGTGIPAEVKEKMFNPFFTTKPAGEGTGLGLSMSHDIVVKQHGGEIDVETEPGAFT
ncbi:MAG: GAF domain-containing protein, partial [Bradyrhizobium sp.]